MFRYLHTIIYDHIQSYTIIYDHNPSRTTKVDGNFARERDFKDIKFLIKIRDIHKIKKKNCISISIFGYKSKEKTSKLTKKYFKRHTDLLLIVDEGKRHYILIKDFKIFMLIN